jgi:hypothetical protein
MGDEGCEMWIVGRMEAGELLLEAALAEEGGGEDGEGAEEPGR